MKPKALLPVATVIATVLFSSCASQNEGMKTVRYDVPPTFGSERVMDQDGAVVGWKKVSAQGLMESNGITFPPGASVVHDGTESTLTVTNTPDQLEAVDSYLRANVWSPGR